MSQDHQLKVCRSPGPDPDLKEWRAILKNLDRYYADFIKDMGHDFLKKPPTYSNDPMDTNQDRIAYYTDGIQRVDCLRNRVRERIGELNGVRWESQLTILGPFAAVRDIEAEFESWCRGQNRKRWQLENTQIVSDEEGYHCIIQYLIKRSQANSP